MSGIRTTDKLTLVIAPQESPRGRHGIQQLNLQEVRYLPVFQISCSNLIFSEGIRLFQLLHFIEVL